MGGVADTGSASRRRRRWRSPRRCRCCPWPPTRSARRRSAAAPACSRRCRRAAGGVGRVERARVRGVGLLAEVRGARLRVAEPGGRRRLLAGRRSGRSSLAWREAGVARYWFTPTTPETRPSDAGIDSVLLASRTVCPFTLYWPRVVSNALSTWAAVPAGRDVEAISRDRPDAEALAAKPGLAVAIAAASARTGTPTGHRSGTGGTGPIPGSRRPRPNASRPGVAQREHQVEADLACCCNTPGRMRARLGRCQRPVQWCTVRWRGRARGGDSGYRHRCHQGYGQPCGPYEGPPSGSFHDLPSSCIIDTAVPHHGPARLWIPGMPPRPCTTHRAGTRGAVAVRIDGDLHLARPRLGMLASHTRYGRQRPRAWRVSCAGILIAPDS